MNFCADKQARFANWKHLFESFKEISPCTACPYGSFHLQTGKFRFIVRFQEGALGAHISLLLIRE